METPITAGLAGLAELVGKAWHAAMGFFGLLMFASALMFNIGNDPVLVCFVGLMMMGWGWGQTECRSFQKTIVGNAVLTRPAWAWSVSGVLLFAVFTGATLCAILRIFGII